MFTNQNGVVLLGQQGADGDEGDCGSAVYSKKAYEDFCKDAVTLGLVVEDCGDGYWRAIDPVDGRAAGEFETRYGGMIAFDV